MAKTPRTNMAMNDIVTAIGRRIRNLIMRRRAERVENV